MEKVKRRKCTEIESVLQIRKDFISKEYVNKINIFRNSVELLFYLSDILNARFYKEYKKTNKPLDGPKALIPILFDRNNHYLIAAFKLALSGLNNPAYLNLRTVFEGINLIYLLHLTEKEADLFYKNQLNILTPSEKKDFIETYKRLKPAKIRNTLFINTKKDKIVEFYNQISNSTHPSIISAISDFILREETSTDVLNLTLGLSAANLIVIKETYFEKFDKEEVDEITNIKDKIAIELGGFMVDMIPNNPTIKGKLKTVL